MDKTDETWANVVGPNYTINCIYGRLVYLPKLIARMEVPLQ